MSEQLAIPSKKGEVSEEEWQLRIDLAAAYRLIALYGWDDLIFTHLSVRIPGDEHHFLINPYGMMFEEITASSLVRIDQEGNKINPDDFDINPAGFTIHSAIHAVREDAACVMHTHTTAGVAVSAQKEGLLPLSQQSLFPLSGLAYHDYEGVALREDEKARLQADLGHARFMILRNHGLLTTGPSVAEAFLNMYILQRACEVQIQAMSGGQPLVRIPDTILCPMHTHTTAGVAVSAQKEGLLPLSQQSLFPLSGLAYHDYEGVALREDEKARLQADLGHARFMILRNHGLLTTGPSVAEAFLNMYILQRACEVQIQAMSGGQPLVRIPDTILSSIREQAKKVTKGMGGNLAWPGLLRKLDRIDPGFRS